MDDTSKYNSFREQWPRFFIMDIIEEQRERILLQKEEIERLNNKMKCVS